MLAKLSGTFHWFSTTDPTVIDDRAAVAVLVSVQVPFVTGPQFSVPVLEEVSVAQFTLTCNPTRSVRYGARVNCELKPVAARALGASTTVPRRTTSAQNAPATARTRTAPPPRPANPTSRSSMKHLSPAKSCPTRPPARTGSFLPRVVIDHGTPVQRKWTNLSSA